MGALCTTWSQAGILLGRAHQLWPEWPLGTEIQQLWGRGWVMGWGVKVVVNRTHVWGDLCEGTLSAGEGS